MVFTVELRTIETVAGTGGIEGIFDGAGRVSPLYYLDVIWGDPDSIGLAIGLSFQEAVFGPIAGVVVTVIDVSQCLLCDLPSALACFFLLA